MKRISTLEEAVDAFRFGPNRMYGIKVLRELERNVQGDVQVTLNGVGSTSLAANAITFRLDLTLTLEPFRELWVSVGVPVALPHEYLVERSVLTDFANRVVAPHLMAYAQSALNPILVAQNFPANLIPQPLAPGSKMYQGESLPQWISSAKPAEDGSTA